MIAFIDQTNWVKKWAEDECHKFCENYKGNNYTIFLYSTLSTTIYKNTTCYHQIKQNKG